MTNSLGATKFMSHVEHLEFGNLAIWHFGILAFFSSGRHLLRFWIRSQSLVVFLVLLGRLCPLRQRSVLPPPPRNWHKGTTSNRGGGTAASHHPTTHPSPPHPRHFPLRPPPPMAMPTTRQRLNNPFGPGVEGNFFSPLGPSRAPGLPHSQSPSEPGGSSPHLVCLAGGLVTQALPSHPSVAFVGYLGGLMLWHDTKSHIHAPCANPLPSASPCPPLVTSGHSLSKFSSPGGRQL